MSSFFSIALTLFLIMDALGILPIYRSLVKSYTSRRRIYVAIRELLFALALMILFHYVGQVLLTLLGVDKMTVQIAGGFILFLIAVRLIFPSSEEKSTDWGESEPFIVPIATPLIAGPSLLSVIMIYAQEQTSDLVVLGAIFVAWFFSALILLFAEPIFKTIKEKGLMACKRLMGLLVTFIAVQMLLEGIGGLLKKL